MLFPCKNKQSDPLFLREFLIFTAFDGSFVSVKLRHQLPGLFYKSPFFNLN